MGIKPSGRMKWSPVYIAPPGERLAARGHGYASDEQKTTKQQKYTFFMMRHLEINIKSNEYAIPVLHNTDYVEKT